MPLADLAQRLLHLVGVQCTLELVDGVSAVGRRTGRQGRADGPRAVEVEDRVAADRKQPRAQRRGGRIEVIGSAPGPDERLLDRVLRETGVAQGAASEAEQRVGMLRVRRAQGRLVVEAAACDGGADQPAASSIVEPSGATTYQFSPRPWPLVSPGCASPLK